MSALDRMYRRVTAGREHTPYGSILCIYVPRKTFDAFKRDAVDYYQPLFNVLPATQPTRKLDEVLFAGAYIYPLDEETESASA